MKKITLNVEGISQKQWSSFVLELNLMRKAWKPYGVDVKLLGHGVKKIVEWGNKKNDYSKKDRRGSKSLEQDELWTELTHQMDTFIDLTKDEKSSKAWVANRLITEIKLTIHQMIENAKTSKSMRLIDAAVNIKTDVFPNIESMLDHTIHNMLLANSF